MRTLLTTAFILAATAAAEAGPPLAVSARLADLPLKPGDEVTLTVELTLADGWALDQAGLPRALVQIDVPASIVPAGEVLQTRQQLARAGFLMMPYEQSLAAGVNKLPLTVVAKPGPKDRIGVNVVAYLRRGEGGPARFARLRVEVPVAPGAEGAAVKARNTSWGDGRAGLQVGDRAAPFTLPRADGTTVSLSDFRGKRSVLLTTYRAFWWPFCAKQLVQLQKMYDQFQSRNVAVIAVAQEDQDLESHGKFLKHFDPAPPFDIVADLDREDVGPYKRTCSYLIDSHGVVLQVFPQTIRYRADWDAILSGIDQALGTAGGATTKPAE